MSFEIQEPTYEEKKDKIELVICPKCKEIMKHYNGVEKDGYIKDNVTMPYWKCKCSPIIYTEMALNFLPQMETFIKRKRHTIELI